MDQSEKANHFKSLHQQGKPLLLYNIWDAAGAQQLEKSGAPAVATGSWSVAGAQGYADGEQIPLDFVLQIVQRIAQTVELPLTVDFEGGYAADPAGLASNVARIIEAGAIGINFEDRVVGGDGLYSMQEQVKRVEAVRSAAAGKPFFINARTDLFLTKENQGKHESFVDQALERAAAYADAGADCFFVPGLTDGDLLEKICAQTTLPVNAMVRGKFSSIEEITQLGVSRISYGPGPYVSALEDLAARYQALQ